jgi:hypothetical protein
MAVAIAFGSRGGAASSSSVATIAGLTFNAAAGDRIIAAAIATEADVTFSGVTIGGVTATVRGAATFASPARKSEIWSASVPTGTTGDVVVTLASGDATISVGTFSITGADTTPTDSDTAGGTLSTISITALTVATDGGAIAAFCNSFGGAAVTWTGATEAFDVDSGASYQHSAAITTTAGTNTITADGATANQSLVGVAWGPAAGGGTIEGAAAQTLAAFTQSAASDLRLKGSASQTLASLTNTSASKLRIKGTA